MSTSLTLESIVITGIGLVTPLGTTRESTWRALLTGERAGRSLDLNRMGQAWKGMAPSPVWRGCPVDRSWSDSGEPIIDDALRAAREAMAHARLAPSALSRVGCVIGASKGGMHLGIPAFAAQHTLRVKQSERAIYASNEFGEAATPPDRVDIESVWGPLPPDAWMNAWPAAPATAVAQTNNIQGPVLAPAAACATGLVSMIRAAELIRDGTCEVVLCGSSDASLLPSLLASYRRLGVMAWRGDPQSACRPFDTERSGFLVGEGAAVMVLESQSHADRRGAKPLAEFVAGRSYSDGAGVAGLDESAEGLSRAISEVSALGGIPVDEIDLVNFHGTGTPQNDHSEFAALARALGGQRLMGKCCAFKGSMGHLMGGAGSVEAALSIMAIRDQMAPPTVNLTRVDPELAEMAELPFTAAVGQPRQINTVLKTSLGFGGPVAAVLLRRLDTPPGRSSY